MSYEKLSEQHKRAFTRSLFARRKAYETWLGTGKIQNSKTVLIVGDKPGPKAPQNDEFHNTPFYSKKYSGGWLNAQLVLNQINETRLFWINSATWNGKPTYPTTVLQHNWNQVISLGLNAHKWCLKVGLKDSVRFDHPQFHKRFKNQEPYPLLQYLASKIQDE